MRVPVAEERLTVGKREVELGAVDIRKTVTEEEQTAPVTLRRDEVNVQRGRCRGSPAQAGEDAFERGDDPRRGARRRGGRRERGGRHRRGRRRQGDRVAEEPGQRHVRKQHVDVDKAYQEARIGFEQTHATTAATAAAPSSRPSRTIAPATAAAHDERYTEREFEDVEPNAPQRVRATDDRPAAR